MTVRHGGATQTPFKAVFFLCEQGIRETQHIAQPWECLIEPLAWTCQRRLWWAFIRLNPQTDTHTHTQTSPLLAKRERGVERKVERLRDNQQSLSSVSPHNKDLTSICQCRHHCNSAWHRGGKEACTGHPHWLKHSVCVCVWACMGVWMLA